MTPASLRDAAEWWQDMCFDIREKRHQLGLQQPEVAKRVGMALDTYQRIEHGHSIAPRNLLQTLSVLGLRAEQVIPVRRRRGRTGSEEDGQP